jgi:hypothetical protein
LSDLSVHLCGEGIVISDGSELVGKISGDQLNAEALEIFVKQNYQLQGTVGYQDYLRGVVAGCSLWSGILNGESAEKVADESAGVATAEVATAVADVPAIDQPTA